MLSPLELIVLRLSETICFQEDEHAVKNLSLMPAVLSHVPTGISAIVSIRNCYEYGLAANQNGFFMRGNTGLYLYAKTDVDEFVQSLTEFGTDKKERPSKSRIRSVFHSKCPLLLEFYHLRSKAARVTSMTRLRHGVSKPIASERSGLGNPSTWPTSYQASNTSPLIIPTATRRLFTQVEH